MKTPKEKLTSRKFLAAVAGVISGLAMVFGLDEHIIGQVSGAIVSVASVVSYIVTEGKIDAAAVGQAAEDVAEAVERASDLRRKFISFKANRQQYHLKNQRKHSFFRHHIADSLPVMLI